MYAIHWFYEECCHHFLLMMFVILAIALFALIYAFIRLGVSTYGLPRQLKKMRAAVKADFEATKEEVLKAYPPQLKAMFGEIGFTKWSGKVYSCIILNPYQVPPSDPRRKFYESFKKVREACISSSRLRL